MFEVSWTLVGMDWTRRDRMESRDVEIILVRQEQAETMGQIIVVFYYCISKCFTDPSIGLMKRSFSDVCCLLLVLLPSGKGSV